MNSASGYGVIAVMAPYGLDVGGVVLNENETRQIAEIAFFALATEQARCARENSQNHDLPNFGGAKC